MATLKKRIEDPREITDPNVVKVVTDHAGDAIYFSRCPIPYDRDRSASTPYFKHIGLYVYQRDFLLNYSALPVGRWNKRNGSNNCARSKTATAFASSKPNTNHWAWIRRRICNGCPRLFEASTLEGIKHG